MKYFALFLFVALSFFGCQDDIQTSNPTLQGLQHGDFTWKATSRLASVDSTGVLTISGTDGFGTMTISLPTASEGTFVLGKGKVPTVTFNQENTTYSTEPI